MPNGVDRNCAECLDELAQYQSSGTELLLYASFWDYWSIQSQIRAQREAIQSLSLQRQLSAAHLQALQMQLEPHFLFNTLNAIRRWSSW